jgi:hypothetical protein
VRLQRGGEAAAAAAAAAKAACACIGWLAGGLHVPPVA